MSLPKTILVVANVYPPRFIGGAELVAHRHACIMRDAGHRVVVFAGEARPGSARHSVVHDSYDGLPVHRVQLKAQDYSSEFICFYHPAVERHFAAVLAQYRPDVVHFHNLNGLSTGLISQASRSGAVTVLTAHDYWGFCHRNTLLLPDGRICGDRTACGDCQMYIHDGRQATIPMRMRNDFIALQFRQLDRLICPSAHLADAYRQSGLASAAKTVVVHNGADIGRLSGISREASNGPVHIAYIGHLGAHKGVITLVDAFAQICRDRSDELSLVGEGGQREELQRRVTSHGIADRVRFTGKVDNREIDRIYRDTDILVVPSVWSENQPVTIMEAMAARTAVIASRIGGIPEFVEDRKTGLLFDPGNAGDLARCLRELIDSPAQRQAYAENAWQAMREETLERQAARILAVYDEAALARQDRGDCPRDRDVMIVCAGQTLNWQCADAIDRIARSRAHPDWRFVMRDWLDENYTGATVILVTSLAVTAADLRPALAARIPLLVPEHHTELRRLCVAAGCGLFYLTADEVEACLERLVSDPALHTALSHNALASASRS